MRSGNNERLLCSTCTESSNFFACFFFSLYLYAADFFFFVFNNNFTQFLTLKIVQSKCRSIVLDSPLSFWNRERVFHFFPFWVNILFDRICDQRRRCRRRVFMSFFSTAFRHTSVQNPKKWSNKCGTSAYIIKAHQSRQFVM